MLRAVVGREVVTRRDDEMLCFGGLGVRTCKRSIGLEFIPQ